MMRNENDLLRGQFVRLAVQDAEAAGECYARWARDEAFSRMLESDPLVLLSTKAHRAKAAATGRKMIPSHHVRGANAGR